MECREQAMPVPYTPERVPWKDWKEKNHLFSCKRFLFLIKYKYGEKKYK